MRIQDVSAWDGVNFGRGQEPRAPFWRFWAETLRQQVQIRRQNMDEAAGLGLGGFRIGWGMAKIVAPRFWARVAGVRPHRRARWAIRLSGLRDVVVGMGTVRRPLATPWLAARFLASAADLAILSTVLPFTRTRRRKHRWAMASIAGLAVLDVGISLGLRAKRVAAAETTQRKRHTFTKSVTVHVPPEVAYQFWRDFENFPRFMRHLESVLVKGTRSYWQARGPGGTHFSWQAETIVDRPCEQIAWRSIPGSEVDHEGSVRFVPAPRGMGTEVHVTLRYRPPLGRLGMVVAKLFGEEPSQQVDDDLRRFKQIVETGEVVTAESRHRSTISINGYGSTRERSAHT